MSGFGYPKVLNEFIKDFSSAFELTNADGQTINNANVYKSVISDASYPPPEGPGEEEAPVVVPVFVHPAPGRHTYYEDGNPTYKADFELTTDKKMFLYSVGGSSPTFGAPFNLMSDNKRFQGPHSLIIEWINETTLTLTNSSGGVQTFIKV